jgi:predicted aspartyl protease
MSTPHRSILALAFLSGSLAACQTPLASRPGREVAATANVTAAKTPARPAPKATAQPDSYTQAIARASSAYNISKSAQSRDDWRLVVDRWQQAIALMTTVPASSPNHDQAVRKLSDYRRDLAYAQQQASQPTTAGSSGGVVIGTSQRNSEPRSVASSSNVPITISPPAPRSSGSSSSSRPSDSRPSEGGVFFAPIVRRAGNTPVIAVTFNGNQTYEMILDTGASGTLITSAMASSLGIRSVGQTSVDTASAQGVSFSLGYVDSMDVGGAVAHNVLVAMGGPELSLGLLGHDFFGNYDIVIRETEVEFRER